MFHLHPDIILGADVLYDSAGELPCSVFLLLLFLKREWSFCVPSIHWLPTNFHSYCHCFGWLTYHCKILIIWPFFSKILLGQFSSPHTYHNRRYLRIISPPVSPGRSVASNISDKSVGFVYAVVIIWLSFWWSSGAWTFKCLKLLDGFSFLSPCKAASLQGNIKFVETALEVWRGKT